MKRCFVKSDKGSVMLEYIVVLAAILGLMAGAEFVLSGKFNYWDGGALQQAFAGHYITIVKVIALPFP